MKIKKNDFIEIEFTGYANGSIFDSTIPDEVKKLNPGIKSGEIKPLIICVGQGMLVKGFDKSLEGKEIGKKYHIKLSPDESFGKRRRELVKTLPLKIFREKNIEPHPGMMLQLDNFLVRIISVSGGRVITDFNNPLSGKEIEYKFKILRKITDIKEKISCLMKFFFKTELKYELKDKKIIFKDKNFSQLINLFKDKFKQILDRRVEVESQEQS